MIPVCINDNFVYFKNGILNTIKLFKTIYNDDKNIVYFSDKLYINNLEQLLNLPKQQELPFAYRFGQQFILNNIKNFRDNICINPILYLLALELLITKVKDIKEFEYYKDKFFKVALFLRQFYKNSELPKVKLTNEDLKSIFKEYFDDEFLKSIIKILLEENYNTEIIESKENKILGDNYYRINARLINGRPFEYTCRIFITNELTEGLYARLSNLNFPILVICTSYSENINFYSSNIRIIQISQTLIMQRYNDLCYLTGFGKGFYNLNENELNEYSFGKLKSYKFLQGILYLEVEKYLKKDDKRIEYLNKKETLDRYYMLQGKNLTIHVTEENMEKVRHIVTLLKSLKYSGIFYNEITTLDLIHYNFDKID